MLNVRNYTQYSGVPLDEQRMKYKRCFRLWGPEKFPGEFAINPEYRLEITQKQMEKMTKAQDLGDLVKIFIISNLNDFKVFQDWKDPNNPSEEEFRDLLADHTKWVRGSFPYIQNRKKEIVRSQLNLLSAAKSKYKELSSKQRP
ncbi:hypothetical protein HYV88_00950 [Candidatus Woesearchaeota archaeon]|nr:hypothetical protein [Candidatus Woesearchaeota archaeon]